VTCLLVRHGETDWGVQHKLQGNTDEAILTEKGREQSNLVAAQLSEILKGKEIEIWTAGLKRTDETAKIIAGVLNYPEEAIQVDVRFQEASHGRFNGSTSAEWENDPEYLSRKNLSAEERFRAPLSAGGESRFDLETRTKAALQEMARLSHNRVKIIVTCGGPMQALFQSITGQYESKKEFHNCEALVIEIASDYSLAIKLSSYSFH
jgi:probable phosphoglycerate mutase